MNKEEGKEIVKAFASAGLPLVLTPIGTALLTLANECFNSSAKMRQDEWMKTLAERIDKQDESFAEKIRNTQNFASLFANAQNGALTDVESDKIGLYANAFINAIKNERMEDTKKHIFLNMLRDFTKLHIDLLQFFAEDRKPKGGFQTSVGLGQRTLYDICADINPVFNSGKPLINAVLRDLYSRALLKSDRIDDYHSTFNGIQKGITPLGQEFLAFISEQEETNG